jgi:hypothetical protein
MAFPEPFAHSLHGGVGTYRGYRQAGVVEQGGGHIVVLLAALGKILNCGKNSAQYFRWRQMALMPAEVLQAL